MIVHLHATSPTSPCPRCGMSGSRVHSRYQRTVADVAFGGRHLMLKLLVRKWVCRVSSCPQHIFAERFPGLVQRYARMTERLNEALQSVGVTTNGADAARILSRLGMPTTAKTIIRRILQLSLPSEGSVRKIGIDEWAWKKGHRYATILVDLEQRRVVQLLSDRSVETIKAWLRMHPEIEIISRDRGKLFREAATGGAPQAQQVVDRFHLQKNFAEALEQFFRHKTRVLKTAARSLAGTAHLSPRTRVPQKAEQERRRRHRQRVAVHKRVWKLFREGYHKERISAVGWD
ncbi:ISL3 family transposase [Ktedonobacter racemifer]|uniref:ISL3 family transposase n=1 Tax=Ktedonobacter racemifer TaxID=363277 RepID=UPI000316B675|nr:ISL3 family transposase [Ktedonobacter racemifer]